MGCSLFGSWVGELSRFYEIHLAKLMKDILEIPAKLHYPTVSELGWKSGIVLVVLVVLMAVVRTLDNTYAAAIFWYMRRAL